MKIITLILIFLVNLVCAQEQNNNLNQEVEKLEDLVSKDFKYDNKIIPPGCLYDLTGHLNGDHIVKKIDLTNCVKSDRNSTYVYPIEEVYMQEQGIYYEALVDWGEMYSRYKLVEYLGNGLYEFRVISFPAGSGTIVMLRKMIVKLNKEVLYDEDMKKQEYLELQLLLINIERDINHRRFNNGMNKKEKEELIELQKEETKWYEEVKKSLIEQYKKEENK